MTAEPPIRCVATLFVVSTVGTLLCLLLRGIPAWMAATVALAAPVHAERVLNAWRRQVVEVSVRRT
jgi:hypothetical protein